MGRKTFGLLFLVLLVLAADVGVKRTEGKECLSRRHGFRGTCLTDHDCGHVCTRDGFTGGKCEGLRRRCFCTRDC